jgi:hypothetical protein
MPDDDEDERDSLGRVKDAITTSKPRTHCAVAGHHAMTVTAAGREGSAQRGHDLFEVATAKNGGGDT